MSSTAIAGPLTPSVEGDREIRATTFPISNLATPTAQACTIGHPLALVAYFYLRFGALVADPVSTLLLDLVPVTVIQAGYAVICLPLSKRNKDPESKLSPTTAKGKQSKTKTAKTPQHETDIGTRISNALISLLLTMAASLPVFVLLVLFGAPLTTHHAQTLLCAAHFSLLAVFPLFYTHGVDRQAWWEIGGAMLPFDGVWGTTIGSLLGAWLGAVPIPLDWDREWQKWPVTIVTGMYLGASIGSLAGRYIFYGKRLSFKAPIAEKKLDDKKSS